MTKLIVTLKGSKLECNHWKEGQEISCHENLAKMFIETGLAIDPNDEVKVEAPLKKEKKK